MNLSGKTIVVTGASSGIGGEGARLARFSGARVIGVDRNDPLITLDGFVKADLGGPTSIDAAIAALPEEFDGPVNAAGVPGTAPRDLVGRVNYLGAASRNSMTIAAVQVKRPPPHGSPVVGS